MIDLDKKNLELVILKVLVYNFFRTLNKTVIDIKAMLWFH